MGKMANALVLTLVIQVALIIVTGTSISSTSLLSFALSPQDWFNTSFLGVLNGLLVAGSLATAILAGTYISKYDWIFRISFISLFLSFMLVLVQLHQYIMSFEPMLGPFTQWAAAILIGALSIFYLLTLLDFISGKD